MFSPKQIRFWRDLFTDYGIRVTHDPFVVEVVNANTVVARINLLIYTKGSHSIRNGARAMVRTRGRLLKFAEATSCNSLKDLGKYRNKSNKAAPASEVYESAREKDFDSLVRMVAQYLENGSFDPIYNSFFLWDRADEFDVARFKDDAVNTNVKPLQKGFKTDKWSDNDQAHLDALLKHQEALNERLGILQAARNEGCSAAALVDNLRIVGANWNYEIAKIRGWLPLSGMCSGFEDEREPDTLFSPVYMLKHHIKYVEIVFNVELSEHNFAYRFEIWPADTIGLRNQFCVRMEIVFDSGGQTPETEEATVAADRIYKMVRLIVNESVGLPFTVENLRHFYKRIKDVK